MISIREPKVTNYFVKHVNVSGLNVRPGEEFTKVKVGYFARRTLGIKGKIVDLPLVLNKIQHFQGLRQPKCSLTDYKSGLTGLQSIVLVAGATLAAVGGFSMINSFIHPQTIRVMFYGVQKFTDVSFHSVDFFKVALGIGGYMLARETGAMAMRRDFYANDLLHYLELPKQTN